MTLKAVVRKTRGRQQDVTLDEVGTSHPRALLPDERPRTAKQVLTELEGAGLVLPCQQAMAVVAGNALEVFGAVSFGQPGDPTMLDINSVPSAHFEYQHNGWRSKQNKEAV